MQQDESLSDSSHTHIKGICLLKGQGLGTRLVQEAGGERKAKREKQVLQGHRYSLGHREEKSGVSAMGICVCVCVCECE